MSPLRRFLRSFVFAGTGVARTLVTEVNMRVHFAGALMVLLFNVMVRPRLGVVTLDLAACTLVVGAELVNAALESLTDLAAGGTWGTRAGAAKDAGAGAVLSIAAGAVVVGVYAGVTSWPWQWQLFSGVHPVGALLSAVMLLFWVWCVVVGLRLRKQWRKSDVSEREAPRKQQ